MQHAMYLRPPVPSPVRRRRPRIFTVGRAPRILAVAALALLLSLPAVPLQASFTTGVSGPETRSLSALDTRRRDALLNIHDYFFQGFGTSDATCTGRPALKLNLNNNNHKGSEGDYMDAVLALLALHDLGELPDSAVETARQLLRYQIVCKWKGPDLGFNEPPFHLGVRTAAMRIFLLYEDTLFPNAGDQNDPDHDVWKDFNARMRSGTDAKACSFKGTNADPNNFCSTVDVPSDTSSAACSPGTENHCAVVNSFSILSAELAGVNDARAAFRRAETIRFLQATIQQGMHEWSAGYQRWTWGAILNLAEFSQDTAVRQMAEMTLDYILAVAGGQASPAGYVASGGVRTYPWDILDGAQWQTFVAQALFVGGDASRFRSEEQLPAEFATSNYRPLTLVDRLYRDSIASGVESRFTQRGYIRHRNRTFLHHNYRGGTFTMAANGAPRQGYYGPYDTLIAYVNADKHNYSHVTAIGFHPLSDTTARIATTRDSQRAFGYRNVILYGHGGIRPNCPNIGPPQDCLPPEQPARLYLSPDFNVEFDSGWAFAHNGNGTGTDETFIAWNCAPLGVQNDNTNYPAIDGYILRAKQRPTSNLGNSCVLEAGDKSSFAGYNAFKAEIKMRANFTGDAYTTRNASGGAGPRITFQRNGTQHTWRVNGVDQTPRPSNYPRADFPGRLVGLKLLDGSGQDADCCRVIFSGTSLSGNTTRVPSSFTFGAGGGTPPGDTDQPSLAITAPAGGAAVKTDTVMVLGWALDSSSIASVTFELDGQPIQLGSYLYGTAQTNACNQNGNRDPACPNVGFRGTLDLAGLADGQHTLRVTATDTVGKTKVVNRTFSTPTEYPGGNALVPILRDAFPSTGSCGRTAGGDLDGTCIERGEIDLAWEAGNCKLTAGGITNRVAGSSPNCWGEVPFAFRRQTRHRDYIGGLDEIVIRSRIQLDRPSVAGAGASWVALGFHDEPNLFFLRLNRDGSWQVLDTAQVLRSGQIADFDPQRWHTAQVNYRHSNRRVRVYIDGILRDSFTLASSVVINVEFAGFHVGFNGGATVGGFLLDDFEVQADAVAATAIVSGKRYHLLKPTSWSASEAIAQLGMGAHLATVGGSSEQQQLINQWAGFDTGPLGIPACGSGVGNCPRMCDIGATGPDGFWIGLNRLDGPWDWAGAPSGYRFWAPGQPQTSHTCGDTLPADVTGIHILNAGRWASWRDEPKANVLGIVEEE